MGTFIQGPPVDCSCYLVVRERTEDAREELQGWEVRLAFDYVV